MDDLVTIMKKTRRNSLWQSKVLKDTAFKDNPYEIEDRAARKLTHKADIHAKPYDIPEYSPFYI